MTDLARVVARAVSQAVRRSGLEETRAGQRLIDQGLTSLTLEWLEGGGESRLAWPLIRVYRRIYAAADAAEAAAKRNHAARVAARADRPCPDGT